MSFMQPKKAFQIFIIASVAILFWFAVYQFIQDAKADTLVVSDQMSDSVIVVDPIRDEYEIYDTLDSNVNYIYNHNTGEWLDVTRNGDQIETYNRQTGETRFYQINEGLK